MDAKVVRVVSEGWVQYAVLMKYETERKVGVQERSK